MVKQKNPEGDYVKKEIMLIVALIALVVGFLGGIFYSAFQVPARILSGYLYACPQSSGPR